MTLPSRVLHVLNSAAGGAALSTLGLIQAFAERGISSSAVCHDAGSEFERGMLRDAVEGRVLFTPLFWWNRKTRAAAWKRPLLELRQCLRTGFGRGSYRKTLDFAERNRVDLIHTNTIVNREGAETALALGIPHVWHVRELVGKDKFCALPLEGPALGKYLAERSSVVVANSHACGSSISPWMEEPRLRVVPNGINVEAFSPRSHNATASDRLKIGVVANLTSRVKNHRLVVESAAVVDSSLPIEYRFYGHDPCQGEGRKDPYAQGVHDSVRRLGLGDRVRFMGFVDDPVRIMSEIDLLVHPTEQESFGRILVEAMAAGLPVVAPNGGGPGEIVVHEETGLLFEPNQRVDLARCVERLCRDASLRRRMGENGRLRAEKLYSLNRYVEGMLKVYEQAMQSQPTRN
ncbi:MAG: glycosyltransferase family 4 protein [Planctomycetales bacterium]